MQIGVIGLGRMGSNMVRRWMRGGHQCVVFDLQADAVAALVKDGATGAASMEQFVGKLKPPRVAWMMVPAGAVDVTLGDLSPRMQKEDIIIDGGNSYYIDDLRRSEELRARGIYYIDAGTSGGVWGLERGFCLMIGGDQAAVRRQASAPEVRRAGEVLDPNAFTIGFARRFATYKRATLLFRDVERLKRILLNKDMPVQIVIAGKAHPKDQPGKSFIREIVQLSRDPELWKHVVFLEDYDMKVGREMVQGVDLWLNNPRRGEEACGTSGMTAAINGVLNLSILDGWFDEAYERSGGWAIGDREPYSDDQDALHASAIYYLLENEIVPMFYEQREQTPREWMRRVKQSLAYISPNFDARRMVREYMTQLYEPAHIQHVRAHEGDCKLVRDKARWNGRVRELWDRVKFVESAPGAAHSGSVTSGKPVPVRAAIDLAGLTPDDVRVEVVMGRVDSNGYLEETEVMVLPPMEQTGYVAVFGKDIVPDRTGRVGYALRVSPNHFDDPLTRPCTSLLKWSSIG